MKLVCSKCGVEGLETPRGTYHQDAIPKDYEPHDIEMLVPRQVYLYGESAKREEAKGPLERIADALEILVARAISDDQRMDT